MKVIVDTSVWSLALRRRELAVGPEIAALRSLIEKGEVAMIGPIRQEILSGIRHEARFNIIRDQLSDFANLQLTSKDYELAAYFYNQCASKGIQASHTDFLIAASAVHRDFSVFSTDRDFVHLSKVIPVRLFSSE